MILATLTILFLLFAAILLCVLYLRRRRYTKERFAFYGLAVLVGVATVTVIPLLSGDSLFFLVEVLAKEFFGIQLVPSSSMYDKLLSVGVFISLVWLVVRLHGHWDGPESERQFQMARGGLSSNLVQDAAAQVNAIYRREPILIYGPKHSSWRLSVEPDKEYDWRRHGARLLVVYSPQYKIDLDADWHEEYSCYVSRYGEQSIPVVVHCPSAVPTDLDVERTRDLCKSMGINVEMYTLLLPGRLTSSPTLGTNSFQRIQIYAEDELLDSLADMPGYRKYLKEYIEDLVLPGASGLTLGDTYVPASGTLGEVTELVSVEQYLGQWMKTQSTGQIALLGDYGQGKSTLSHKIAYDAISNRDRNNRIPIVIELRGKSPRTMAPEEVVYPWCRKFGVDPDALLALNSAGRLVFILDGFDEMDFVGDAALRLEHFRSLWRFAASPSAKVIFTGRPNFFFDTSERKRALLLGQDGTDRLHCLPVRLAPFTRPQVERALRAYPAETRTSILAVIDGAEPESEIADLLARPSTLNWAAAIWSRLGPAVEHRHVGSAYVIGELLAQSYDRQSNKRLQTTVLAAEREYFSLGVAVRMHKDFSGVNQISSDNLRDVVRSLIDTIPDQLRDFRDAGEEQQLAFSERITDASRRLETVLTDVRSCGVLVEDVSRPGYLKFAHKAFYEYLIATYVAYQLLTRRLLKISAEQLERSQRVVTVRGLSEVLGRTRLYGLPNHEITQFAGQLFAQELIERRGRSSDLEKVPHILRKALNISLELTIIRMCGGNYIERFAGQTYVPLIRLGAWRIKIWYHACIASGVPQVQIGRYLGSVGLRIMSGEWVEENPIDNFVARALSVPESHNKTNAGDADVV